MFWKRKSKSEKVRDFFVNLHADPTVNSDRIKLIAKSIFNQINSCEKNDVDLLLIGFYNYVLCYYDEFSFTPPDTATAAIHYFKFDLKNQPNCFAEQLIDFAKQTEQKVFLLPTNLSGTIPPFLAPPGIEKLYQKGEYLRRHSKGAHNKVQRDHEEFPEDSSHISP